MRIYFCLFILSCPALASAFERSGWSGEGVPVISFKKDQIVFCESPNTDTSCALKGVPKGKKIPFTDSAFVETSKVITVKPVEMEVISDFYVKDYDLKVKKGDIVTNYQYASEGYYTVGIGEATYEIDLHGYREHLTNYDAKPEVEFWVRFKNRGWLKLTDPDVQLHDRWF